MHDQVYGAYASGPLHTGRQGDFATSPSLGAGFAQLLAMQLADWFQPLQQRVDKRRLLSFIVVCPYEGDLGADLVSAL